MPRKAQPRAVVEPFNTGRKTQAPAAPTGMPYGAHQALVEDQRQLALPTAQLQPGAPPAPGGPAPAPAGPPPAGAPAPPPAQGAGAAMLAMDPASFPPPLSAPSNRPTEPVMAGANTPYTPPGLGAPAGPDPRLMLQALYQVNPNADIADLIQHLDG